jgi:alkaline phosphatase D
VQNLTAGTEYYYRFKSNGKTSPVGIAKTLPSNPSQVKMVVFSCANYTNGFFNVYTEAAKIADLDVTLHLGDYIYEYGMHVNDEVASGAAYATENAVALGRVLPENNSTECLTLEDYRRRYALYHTDSGTQAIHAACPMIVVWDDHEIANDAYENGAQNHDDTEGDFITRTQMALQAYFEWLPIRPVSNQKEIYRTFDFGDLVSLHMLETRIFGRDEQLSYANYYDAQGNFNATAFTTDLTSSTRTMLGASQLQWLQGQLATSTATWQVLGQQVLMGKMSLPAELLAPIGMLENPAAFGTTTEALITQINTLIGELTTLKVRQLQGDTTLTDEEIARLATVLPYNLDAWDGYFVERETIFGTAKALNKNLVTLAGDTHNGWSSQLKDISGSVVGVEFATSSVSSPGLEQYVGLPNVEASSQFEQALTLLIDDLVYANTFDRGFLAVTFTVDSATAEWTYVSAYDSTTYAVNTQRTKTITHTKSSELV